jgi:hypothetical protein
MDFFARAARFGVRRLDAAFERSTVPFQIVHGVVICDRSKNAAQI